MDSPDRSALCRDRALVDPGSRSVREACSGSLFCIPSQADDLLAVPDHQVPIGSMHHDGVVLDGGVHHVVVAALALAGKARGEVTGRAVLQVAHPDVGELAFRSEEHTSEIQALMRTSYALYGLKYKN